MSSNGQHAEEAGTFEHTVHDSGRVLRLRKFPYRLYLNLKKQFKLPEPPLAPGPNDTLEPNRSDPDYIRECQRLRDEFNEKLNWTIVEMSFRGLATEAQRLEAQVLRATLTEHGVSVEWESDDELFLWGIAIRTPQDRIDLERAISSRSFPTPEGVARMRESFRPEVEVPEREGANV